MASSVWAACKFLPWVTSYESLNVFGFHLMRLKPDIFSFYNLSVHNRNLCQRSVAFVRNVISDENAVFTITTGCWEWGWETEMILGGKWTCMMDVWLVLRRDNLWYCCGWWTRPNLPERSLRTATLWFHVGTPPCLGVSVNRPPNRNHPSTSFT